MNQRDEAKVGSQPTPAGSFFPESVALSWFRYFRTENHARSSRCTKNQVLPQYTSITQPLSCQYLEAGVGIEPTGLTPFTLAHSLWSCMTGFPNGHQSVPVARTVDKRHPEGQLMAERRENGFNNWPAVGTSGNEIHSHASELSRIHVAKPDVITSSSRRIFLDANMFLIILG